MVKLLILLLFIITQILELKSAPGTEFFENLIIEIPQGPFFPGDKVKFSCATTKLKTNGGRLEWIFQIETLLFRQVVVDPKDDFVDIFDDALNRTSYIKIPSEGATGIACRWVDGEREYKKIVNIDVLNVRVFTLESIYPLLDKDKGPALVIERFDPEIEPVGSNPSTKYVLPHIITNQTVELPGEIKSFRLSCIHLSDDGNGDHNGAFKHNWSSSTEKTKEPDPVVLLNSLALVNQKAVASGRFPSECMYNSTLRLHPGVRTEILEVIIPPLNSQRVTKYTCKGTHFGSDVTIRFNGRTKATPNSPKDDEFLELISTIMQILQTSNTDGSSGSGPLYGVGFGSSTIMILMGLTIFYLKRRLKQLQEQVLESDLRKRKRTLITENEEEL